ncbi:hypothetical protein BJL95_02815 [Methylomonas sp. LWB]|uniref:DUF6624 domain-containing protein n=1 Tax=Methylomonas sp. LWB TaxID=1905845 RepID=UPI0008D965DC|nr:DUF6624 domain-containing protein [Methylomonas sp. LWB]OHX35989.1 hypothetical protein BJL95_02815 [Methylomonas sp. LWB]
MNQTLRTELLAMREKDISTRASLVERGELDDKEYHPEMRLVHEENNKRIKEIIEEFGWPLESEVGEDGSEATWLIVQHAVLEPEFQEECINLLKAAVERGEAKGWYLAYLQDRVLIRQGKLQIYGTQHEVKEGLMYPLPTENPAEVNVRRAALDLWSQEEHTEHLQKDYDKIQSNKASHGG